MKPLFKLINLNYQYLQWCLTLSVGIPILQTCFGDEPELSYFREQALGVVRENVSVCVDWAS